MRDGKPLEVAGCGIVPGDVVLLSAGDLIPGRRRVARSARFLRQAGAADRRGVSGRKEAGLPGLDRYGSLRTRAMPCLPAHPLSAAAPRALVVKTGTGTAIGAIADSISPRTAADGFRDRHTPFRHADHAADVPAGAVRVAGKRHVPQAVARIVSVRRGAGGGTDAGTAADGGVGHPVARRAAHGEKARDRQAARCDSEPGIDGCAVHGQDRHTDRGEDPS